MAKIYTATLIEKKYLSKNIVRIAFKVDVQFRAGQFFNIYYEPDPKTSRSYSILNPPSKSGVLESCVKILETGYGSDKIRNMKIGEEYTIQAPMGILVFDNKTKNKHHVFICTGTGVTPFYSILMEHVPKHPEKQFTLIYGTTVLEELVLHDEFTDLQKANKNFQYIPTLTREYSKRWTGKTGRVHNHLGRDFEGKTFYICGLKDLVSDTINLLRESGVADENIHFERYD